MAPLPRQTVLAPRLARICSDAKEIAAALRSSTVVELKVRAVGASFTERVLSTNLSAFQFRI